MLDSRIYGIGCVLVTLGLSACAVVYEAQQESARKACERLPNPQEMRACLSQISVPYEQYGRQRDTLRSGPSAPPPGQGAPEQ